MATIDFVLASARSEAGNTSSASAQGVAIRVPDVLDPYSQQELRDLLTADFQRGARAVIERAQLRTPEDAASLQADFSKLQSSLQEVADRWLAARSATQSIALPTLEGEAVLIHAEQELQQFESWLQQTRTLIAGQTEDQSSAIDRHERQNLADQLQAKLANLAALLDGILEGVAGNMAAESTREFVIQELLAAIEEGHALRAQLSSAG